MNNLLIIVEEWLALNNLVLNLEKTVYITFGNYCDSVPVNLEIKIEDKYIKKVEHCKYLGLIIDQNLKWDKHIEYVINKTKYLIYIVYKISKFMQTDILRMIYYAFFHSIINYGIIAWGGAYMNYLNLLQNVQKRILKIVNKNTFVSENPMNLRQLFAYESLQYYYNVNSDKFSKSNSVTRNKNIQIPKIYKTVNDKNSYIKAIKLFNSLPNEYKLLNISKSSNRYTLKEWIKSNIFA